MKIALCCLAVAFLLLPLSPSQTPRSKSQYLQGERFPLQMLSKKGFEEGNRESPVGRGKNAFWKNLALVML
jgi:hypothetical protein